MKQTITVYYGNKRFKKKEETFLHVDEVTYQQGYEVLRLVQSDGVITEVPMQNISKVVFVVEPSGSDATG